MKSSLFTCSSKPQTHFFKQCSGPGKCIIQAFRTQHTFAEFHSTSLLVCFYYAQCGWSLGEKTTGFSARTPSKLQQFTLANVATTPFTHYHSVTSDWLVNSESSDLTSIYKFGGWKSHCRWLQLKFTKALENPLVFITFFFITVRKCQVKAIKGRKAHSWRIRLPWRVT